MSELLLLSGAQVSELGLCISIHLESFCVGRCLHDTVVVAVILYNMLVIRAIIPEVIDMQKS